MASPLRAGRGGRGAHLDARDGLDALGDFLGRHRSRVGTRLAGDQLHQHDDADDRHEERSQNDDDELLRSLDEGRMLVVRAHCRWPRYEIKV